MFLFSHLVEDVGHWCMGQGGVRMEVVGGDGSVGAWVCTDAQEKTVGSLLVLAPVLLREPTPSPVCVCRVMTLPLGVGPKMSETAIAIFAQKNVS